MITDEAFELQKYLYGYTETVVVAESTFESVHESTDTPDGEDIVTADCKKDGDEEA